MRLPLVLILIAPLVEIAGFIVVGQAIGVLPTIGLVVLAAILGIALLRYQGTGILLKLQDEARRGRNPGRQLVHAALLVIAAFLLIIPGFVGDIIGLLLFIPALRDLAWTMIRGRFVVRSNVSSAYSRSTREDDVIDLGAEDYSTDEPRQDTPWRGPRVEG